MVETNLVEIHYSQNEPNQVLILQEKDGERSFAVFVGPHEAEMLLLALNDTVPPRPLTHDLVLNAIHALGGTLTGVWVNELKGGTFFGKLLVRTPDGDTVQVDCRPSDAVVLAAKNSVPIYVAEEVLEEASLDADEDDENPEMDDDDDDGEF
ncbi:MAG: bifunctional nuclease family protein [Candidatus Sumerlaeia bacterium]|nr:bifunctional nuclease family protein [Candidatus Sumerlaeia bacterium]